MLKFLSVLTISAMCLGVGGSASAASRNPILSLPSSARTTFACIMWHESRSTLAHPNLRDNNANGGSSGVFQIIAPTWNYWAPKVGVHVPVWRATYYQQSLVAVEIWRNDSFKPWASDGCVG